MSLTIRLTIGPMIGTMIDPKIRPMFKPMIGSGFDDATRMVKKMTTTMEILRVRSTNKILWKTSNSNGKLDATLDWVLRSSDSRKYSIKAQRTV